MAILSDHLQAGDVNKLARVQTEIPEVRSTASDQFLELHRADGVEQATPTRVQLSQLSGTLSECREDPVVYHIPIRTEVQFTV